MTAEFLLLILIVILTIDLLTTKLDLMNPTALMVIGFIIGVGAFVGIQKKWQIDLGIYPAFLILLGIISFALGAKIFQAIVSIDYIEENNTAYRVSYLAKNKQFILYLTTVVILLQCLVTFLTYKELRNITGATSISTMISSYRDSLIGSSISLRISFITSFLQKLLLSFSLMLYIYAFTEFLSSKWKIFLFVPILFSSFQQLLMGGRLQIFRFLIMGIFIYYILLRNKNNWSVSEIKKIIKIGIIVFILSIPFFYSLKFLLGRASTESLLPYVLRYLGGSTGAFALFVNDGLQHSLKFGQETFMGIYDVLGRIQGFNGLVALPWAVAPSGDVVGNIYGADRRFLADFGVMGIFILNFIMGAFYGGFYGIIMKKLKHGTLPIISLTIYGYLLYATFFQFIEGYFYFSIISINTLVQIILLVMVILFTYTASRFKVK